MNFQEAHTYLDSLQFHKIKLGLDSMRSFLAKVDRPEKKLKYIHVAGTNGKGSVSVTVLTLLVRAGYRVGLYTSPHLSSVRERFRINDTYISEEEFARLASRIREVLAEEMITYFEFTTALALLWFAESDLDLVILETGLGGRLDATNVITPLVSIITNVSMDHEAYLGETLEEVAFEKAGIIKPGVPVITGAYNDISREVIRDKCRQEKAPFYLNGDAFTTRNGDGQNFSWHGCDDAFHGSIYNQLKCAMKGDYQQENAALALAAVELLRDNGFSVVTDDLPLGLRAVKWPGRLEHLVLHRVSRQEMIADQYSKDVIHYLIDGAHNPAGVESLLTTLQEEYSYKRLVIVWGAMVDKDLSKTVPAIADMAAVIILTQPDGERSAKPQELFEQLRQQEARDKAILIKDVRKAIERAEKEAGPEDLIVVAGSLYLIGAVRTFLVGELVEQ